jgi:hypothetical protein
MGLGVPTGVLHVPGGLDGHLGLLLPEAARAAGLYEGGGEASKLCGDRCPAALVFRRWIRVAITVGWHIHLVAISDTVPSPSLALGIGQQPRCCPVSDFDAARMAALADGPGSWPIGSLTGAHPAGVLVIPTTELR